MAGLPWIKVWTRVSGHPKVQRLERAIRVKDALGIVVRLWCWTADYAPAGTVDEAEALTAVRFARADACRTSPSDLLAVMVEVGLLDRIPGGFRVHDWDEMQTTHVEAEEKRKRLAADRQARYRERHADASRNASRNGDVTQASVTEKEREKEKETEIPVIQIVPDLPLSSEITEPPPPKAAAAKARRVVKGPLGAQFVRLVSAGLGHGFAALTDSDEAEALEAAVRGLGGPEAARNVIASTCRARGEEFDPQSEKLLLSMLLDCLPPGVSA